MRNQKRLDSVSDQPVLVDRQTSVTLTQGQRTSFFVKKKTTTH
jgi:hypothetical protein